MHLVIGLCWIRRVLAPSSFSSLEGVLTLRRETDDEMPTDRHAHDVTYQPDLNINVKPDQKVFQLELSLTASNMIERLTW
jgi:hypothetical protein